MPWRDIIFTDTGAVYPTSWNIKTQQGRDISETMVLPATALAPTPPQGSSERIATQHLFSELLSRLDAAPESPAAYALPHAALPAETSPHSALRTNRQQASEAGKGSMPSLLGGSARHPQNGGHPPLVVATLARDSPSRTGQTLPHTGTPTTSPVNLA
jgi:hypothetical protein